MRSKNEVSISGAITRLPDYHVFGTGARVANFSLSVDRTRSSSDYPDLKGWNEVADAVRDHGAVGNFVIVEGAIRTELYEDKNAPAPANGEKTKKRKAQYIIAKHVRILDKDGRELCDVTEARRDEREATEAEQEPAAAG